MNSSRIKNNYFFSVCFAQIIEEIPSDSELILDNSDGSLEVVGGKQNDETNVEKLVQVPDGGKEKEFSTIEEKGNVTLTETNPHEPKHNIYRNCVSGKVYGAVEVSTHILNNYPPPQNK